MRTLFQRLKPEVLISIYDEQSKYPSLIESVLEELKDNVSVLSLRLDTSLFIYEKAYGFDDFNLSKFFEIFPK